jgi:hypothetical protein
LAFPVLVLGDGRLSLLHDVEDFRVMLELSAGTDLRGGFYARARVVDAELGVHRFRKLDVPAGGLLTWGKRRQVRALELEAQAPQSFEELRQLVRQTVGGELGERVAQAPSAAALFALLE